MMNRYTTVLQFMQPNVPSSLVCPRLRYYMWEQHLWLLLKSLTPLCQSLLQPLFVHLSVMLLMKVNCVWKPRWRDRAKVHDVTALQQLIHRIRSMKVPPEDNVNPSGDKVTKVCKRYGETTLTPVLRVPACQGFCSASDRHCQLS